jgi:intracellular multiplication protein IcmJ
MANLLPIILGVRRSSDSGKATSKTATLDRKKAEQVFKRDDNTCRFCGFHATQFQRIVPSIEAGDPPFATACGFCEQCVMLDRVGLSGAGLLIWLPEITQSDLNNLLRAIYVARAAAGEIATHATRALDALMGRRSDVKKRLGTDDPLILSTVLHESLTDDEYEHAPAKLEGIRLLPMDRQLVRTAKGEVNQFPQMLKYWTSPEGPFAKLPANQWLSMFKSAPTAAIAQS